MWTGRGREGERDRGENRQEGQAEVRRKTSIASVAQCYGTIPWGIAAGFALMSRAQ